MGQLRGKVAIVTGAGSGIGAAVAHRFAAEGCAVSIADINGETAQQLASEIDQNGGRALAVLADVTNRHDVDAVFSTTESELGLIDVVVNNAGIFGNVKFESMTDEQWNTMMFTNAGSAFIVTQKACRRWLKLGRPGNVINMASISATVAFTESAHYSASKAAVAALTRCVAAELGPCGIRVNAIAPGIISTSMTAPALAEPELVEHWKLRIPLRRYGSADDVAGLALFLASDDSSYINGEVIVVDGGATPSWPKPSDRDRTAKAWGL